MTDQTLKVKVAYKGGDWNATSLVYSITGIGETPEEALADYTDRIRKLYNGKPFSIAAGKPFNVSYMMTSVSAEVYLGVVQETPLTEFGIDVEDAPQEKQELLEGKQIPLLEGETSDEEFRCGNCYYNLNCKTSYNDEPCGKYAPIDEDDEINTFGVCLNKYNIEDLLMPDEMGAPAWVILGFGDHAQYRDLIYLYEQKKDGIRCQKFVGLAKVAEIEHVDKIDLNSDLWRYRTGLSEEEIISIIGNKIGTFEVVRIGEVRPFKEPIPIPDGKKAPRKSACWSVLQMDDDYAQELKSAYRAQLEARE